MYEPIYLTPSSGFNVESYFDNDPLTSINNIGNTSQIDHLKDESSFREEPSEPVVKAAVQENYKFTDFNEPVTSTSPAQQQFTSTEGDFDFLHVRSEDEEFLKQYTEPRRFNTSSNSPSNISRNTSRNTSRNNLHSASRNAGQSINDPVVGMAADFLAHVGDKSQGTGQAQDSGSSSKSKNRTREMIYDMLSEGALNVWSAADQEAKAANQQLADAMAKKLADAKAQEEASRARSLPWGAIAGGAVAITVVGIAVYFLARRD